MFFPSGAAITLLIDLLTKQWAARNLGGGREIYLSSFLKLHLLKNEGGFFGLIARGELFTAFTFLVVALLVILFLRFPFLREKIPSLSLGLVLGGALGNLADRLARGYVIDFIDMGFWPVFNIADVGIALGSLLLFIFLMRALVGEREER